MKEESLLLLSDLQKLINQVVLIDYTIIILGGTILNQKQTDITTGKQIRHLRTQSGMTQEELAGELNVTRQALSNWERDVNEPDLNMLKKICFLFGVNMDDFAKEVITKMETYEKKEKRQFNKYDMAIGLFYGVGIFLGIGIFFVGGFMTMSGAGWGASLFGGGCFSLVFGLICHAVITLRRNDK